MEKILLLCLFFAAVLSQGDNWKEEEDLAGGYDVSDEDEDSDDQYEDEQEDELEDFEDNEMSKRFDELQDNTKKLMDDIQNQFHQMEAGFKKRFTDDSSVEPILGGPNSRPLYPAKMYFEKNGIDIQNRIDNKRKAFSPNNSEKLGRKSEI